jgi:DNA mismatch repair protein MutS2
LDKIEAERQEVLAEARAQAQTEVEEVREELRRVRKQLRTGRQTTDLSLSSLKKLGKEISDVEEQLEPEAPEEKSPSPKRVRKMRDTLEVGDTVLVKSLDTKGEILSMDKKEAEVAVGRLHTRVSLADLELVESEEKVPEESSPVRVKVSAAPKMELDLRGQRVEEGLATLENYLDSALLADLPYVRIIHGKGTGRLREAVRDALRSDGRIRSWEEGKAEEGGAGVTVVKLNVD